MIRQRGEGDRQDVAMTLGEYRALRDSDPRPWPEPVTRLLDAIADTPDDDWRQRAACHPNNRPDHWNPHDPRTLTAEQWTSVFFPPTGGSTRPAQRICETCPVTAECGEQAAADFEVHGVWGGQPASVRVRARMSEIVHGTVAGCNAHWREGTKPCPPCLAAKVAYNRKRKARREAAA